MSSDNLSRLGRLQLRILKILWECPGTTVADVYQALGTDNDLAYTTVATMLRKMEARQLISHRTEGRTFFYTADVDQDEVARHLADDLVDRVFEGRLADMFAHLLKSRDVSATELKEMERLISKQKALR
jgi:predicted transcriptional regulator